MEHDVQVHELVRSQLCALQERFQMNFLNQNHLAGQMQHSRDKKHSAQVCAGCYYSLSKCILSGYGLGDLVPRQGDGRAGGRPT
jgi:hypothetical protein